MLAGIYFLLPGIPFIYQGQEIGMENLAQVDSLDQLDDCANTDLYNTAIEFGFTEKEALEVLRKHSRDNARTPFQWTGNTNAGFSTSQPWLLVNPNYKEINLESQLSDSDSVYSFYKKLIALRKNPEYEDSLIYGSFEPILTDVDNLVCYYRKGTKKIVVIANFQNKGISIKLDSKISKVLLANRDNFDYTNEKLNLLGYDYIVAEVL